MFHLWWPLLLTVLGNVIYQLGAHMVSGAMHPLSALVVSYLVAGAFSFVLYGITAERSKRKSGLFAFSWPAAGLGFSIVIIELGNIYMYKMGWQISTSFTVINASVTAALVVVGLLAFHETMNLRKAAGIALSLAGVILIAW